MEYDLNSRKDLAKLVEGYDFSNMSQEVYSDLYAEAEASRKEKIEKCKNSPDTYIVEDVKGSYEEDFYGESAEVVELKSIKDAIKYAQEKFGVSTIKIIGRNDTWDNLTTIRVINDYDD